MLFEEKLKIISYTFIILGIASVCAFGINDYINDNTITVTTNITVIEKYPPHSYRVNSLCGKTPCTITRVDPPFIVDSNGNTYIFNFDAFGEFQIGNTYTILYTRFLEGSKIIRGIVINGTPRMYRGVDL